MTERLSLYDEKVNLPPNPQTLELAQSALRVRRAMSRAGTVQETEERDRGEVSPVGWISGHLDPLGHVRHHSVHGLHGVFPLWRRGPVMVAFHVDTLVVDGHQVRLAAPGGQGERCG